MKPALPIPIARKTIGFAESSYGVNCVTLVLADGRHIREVSLAMGSEIIKIGGRVIVRPEDLDFDVTEVVDVIAEPPFE